MTDRANLIEHWRRWLKTNPEEYSAIGGLIVRATIDRLEADERALADCRSELTKASSAQRDSNVAAWEMQHPGKAYADVHMRWWPWDAEPPLVEDEHEVVDAVTAALLQEGMTAWHGDGTSIVAHMVRAQSDARKKAQAAFADCQRELAKVREELTRMSRLSGDMLQAQQRLLSVVTQAIGRIQGFCGHPDAAAGCRLVLLEAERVLDAIRKVQT